MRSCKPNFIGLIGANKNHRSVEGSEVRLLGFCTTTFSVLLLVYFLDPLSFDVFAFSPLSSNCVLLALFNLIVAVYLLQTLSQFSTPFLAFFHY
jgi:hypothetical protein